MIRVNFRCIAVMMTAFTIAFASCKKDDGGQEPENKPRDPVEVVMQNVTQPSAKPLKKPMTP